MNQGSTRSAEEFRILQEAAEWFATLGDESAGAEEQAAWQQWLDAAPAHRQAWQKVESVSARFGALDPAGARALETLEPPAKRRSVVKAILLLAGAGLGTLLAGRRDSRSYIAALGADYRSGVGEVLALPLPDGSAAWLDTASAADVRYDDDLRRIALRRGRILVATRADARIPARPLVVDVPGLRLRALGTRFAVALADKAVHLAVFDGAVRIEPEDGSAQRVIAAGYQVTLGGSSPAVERRSDENGAAWSRRRLVATQRPLGEVLAELARYRHGYLGCDPAVAGLRVVGSYPLDDTDRALAMLAGSLPVRIEHTTPWWTSVRPR